MIGEVAGDEFLCLLKLNGFKASFTIHLFFSNLQKLKKGEEELVLILSANVSMHHNCLAQIGTPFCFYSEGQIIWATDIPMVSLVFKDLAKAGRKALVGSIKVKCGLICPSISLRLSFACIDVHFDDPWEIINKNK